LKRAREKLLLKMISRPIADRIAKAGKRRDAFGSLRILQAKDGRLRLPSIPSDELIPERFREDCEVRARYEPGLQVVLVEKVGIVNREGKVGLAPNGLLQPNEPLFR
jgi:hypothetical protein